VAARLTAVLLALILPSEFRNATYVALGVLAVAGLWYVVGLHRRLSSGAAGATTLAVSSAAANNTRSPDPAQ